MVWRIDVFPQEKVSSEALAAQMKDLGLAGLTAVYTHTVYFIETTAGQKALRTIAESLLIDPVIESYHIAEGMYPQRPAEDEVVISYNPGVCDPVALSLEKAIHDLDITVSSVRTARLYRCQGASASAIRDSAAKLLYNPLIEHILEYEKVKDVTTLDEFAGADYTFSLKTIDILGVNEERLSEISQAGCLSLSVAEMKIIQDYFKRQGRNPTDCELETIATLWSEHCAHKTFRGVIDYQEHDAKGVVVKQEKIDNLLKATVMKATKEINSPDCVSVFHDNAGVVRFDEKNNICFKVETHNHPSSLEPYGGASTGIGGVIRDILGTGCSARPFASTDVFCFAPWHIPHSELPLGLLHPRRIITGVVGGVRDYGNRMGIPTVAGAVLFDERFLGNPLVYCGTLGIMPQEKSFKEARVGDQVILCGAQTGRDGIHGATFSSKELDEQTVGLTSAVQIGNAIEEKKLTEAILRARDEDLFDAITDCGAGGISSAITELGQEHGVSIDLEKVPLKYRGLSYTDIWISESQERMVIFAAKENLPRMKEIFAEEAVPLTVVGEVTGNHTLQLAYDGQNVCDLKMDFLFNLPKLEKKARWIRREESPLRLAAGGNYTREVTTLLSTLNIANKDWILRQYDHEVQAGSAVKGMCGFDRVSVSDAAVVRPDLATKKCVVIGMGVNPFYSDLDPYWMAALAIDEALRNVVATGGILTKTFILDNFSWGSPLDEEILGGLVRASKACYDFATHFGTPFISGKDSLYNEYTVEDKRISIPGTLLISAASIIDDWSKVVTSPLKKAENLLYAVGLTKPELGCSEYARRFKLPGGRVPKVNGKTARGVMNAVSAAIGQGVVSACHDLSEGGIAVAAAEMCMSADLGASLFLAEMPQDEGMNTVELLFSESPTRFLIEVDKEKKAAFEACMQGIPHGLVGCVSKEKQLVMYDVESQEVVMADLADLRYAWQKPFQEFRYHQENVLVKKEPEKVKG